MAAARKGLFSSLAADASSAAAGDWADDMAEAMLSAVSADDEVALADELRKLKASCKAAYEGDDESDDEAGEV